MKNASLKIAEIILNKLVFYFMLLSKNRIYFGNNLFPFLFRTILAPVALVLFVSLPILSLDNRLYHVNSKNLSYYCIDFMYLMSSLFA